MIATNAAIEKIRSEIETASDPMEKMLGEQIIENITTVSRATNVLQEDKTLKECKKAFDAYASKNKSGSQSIIGPKQAEELIIKYFGFDEEKTIQSTAPSNTINFADFL